MSIQVLQGLMTHEARHDLESFFWLLLYIVLRHTNHTHSSGPDAITEIFGSSGSKLQQCKGLKQAYLAFQPPVGVHQNDPLTYILKEFHALCKKNFSENNAPVARPCMTHRDVLDIFDRAFTMDWPKNDDGPRPWKVPGNALHTVGMTESINKAKTQGSVSHATHGDQALFEGRPVQLEPEATHSPLDDDGRPQGPGTADNSVIGDDSLAMTESSDEDVPSDAEDMRPNAPDAPQGLALLDVNMFSGAPARSPLACQDVHDAIPDSGIDPVGPPSSSALDVSQGLAPHCVNQAPRASTTLDPPSHTDNHGDVQNNTAGPSRPTRRARSPSKTKRAPAKSRARATRQVAETWPASNADGVGTQPSHRYNLRSSSRATESGQTRMTRSRTKAASQQRDAGTRESSVGKRSRATRDDVEDLEDGFDAQSSKRQRTLSQTRGRMKTRSGKK